MISTLIPTHNLAQRLIAVVDTILDKLGIAQTGAAEEIVYTVIIIAIALLLGWLVRTLIVYLVNRRFGRKRSPFIDDMIRLKVVGRSSHAIPPLVFLALVPVAFETDTRTLTRIEDVVIIYFLVVLAWSICTFFEILWKVYDRNGNTRNLPLKGILNIAKGGVLMVCTIIIVSILLHRSPLALLTGLGAFAAALMLVFRDSLLGFVAGIQLSVNDMLHVGDWIMVPDTVANGIVTDVSLTAVKIRNWNNTTVTMPPYTLVQNGFQNWTQMKKRGRRQIERSVLIDVTGVRPATPELLARCRSLPFMAEYIDEMQRLAATGNATAIVGDTISVNGSLDTNLGLFRAYAGLFVTHHPWVAQGKGVLCMVRLLEHTPHGIPMQVFCYINTVDWVEYEGVSSDIFEHIIAAAPMFGLSAFSYPTGRDVVNIANAAPAAMPYYGDADLPVLPYAPRTNFLVPPNTAGDPGYTFSTVAVYPADEGTGAAT
jgi:miniconductance mechanosensitive channel